MASEEAPYIVDPKRLAIKDAVRETGINVRARTPEGKWDAYDISTFDRESLQRWLRQ